MDLHNYLEIFRRRWVSVTLVALASIAVAASMTLAMTAQYTATTRLFFAVESSESVSDLAQGSYFAEAQMTSYAQVATSPLVLNPVIDRLDLRTTSAELAQALTTTIPPDTVILEISAVDRDPKRAASIVNAVGDEVAEVAGELSPERADGGTAVKATTLAPALVPTDPSSPTVPRNLALGTILGLLLGFGVALLRNVLDTRVRTERDARAVAESPVLGVIGHDDKVPAHPIVLRDAPLSAAAEAFRRLRTNLQFTDLGDRPRSIVITSAVPGEGKSTTALNLAVSLAEAGSRVILVDADLRRPSIATYMGLEGRVGLTTVLIGRAEIGDVVQHWEQANLDVLPSGRIPPNPSELLGSAAMVRLLAELTARYDVVLLDSPPLLPVTDAAVLSNLTGGSLVVVGADRVRRPQLRAAIDSLAAAGAHLHGMVLNQIARQEAGAYVYDAGYAPTGPPAEEPPIAVAAPATVVVPTTAPKRARMEPKHVIKVGGPVNGSEATKRRATPVGQ